MSVYCPGARIHRRKLIAQALPEWIQPVRTTGLLGRLSDSVVASLLQGARRVSYPEGAVALRWDEQPKTAIVLSGTLRQFISLPDGSQATIRYLRCGDTTGVFAPRRPRLSRALIALEPCELVLVDGDRIKQLALAQPAFGWALIEELTTVLNLNQKALYVRAVGSVRERVISAIVDRANASGGLVAGKTVEGTQFELANAAGTAREVVASVLQDLKRAGLVEVKRRRIVIVDPGRLTQEAGLAFGLGAPG